MQNIVKLISSLKPGEVKLIRHFYQMRRGYEVKKKEKLLVLSLTKPDCTDSEAKKYLYATKKSSAFSNLKLRLKTDILNILLLQDGEARYRSPYAKAVFDCRRLFLQGEILLSRGVYAEAITVFDRAIELAIKYELHAEQAQIMDLYRMHLVMREDGKNFSVFSEGISRAISLLEKVSNAKHKHYELTVPGLFRSGNCPEMLKKSRLDLEQMGDDFRNSRSNRVGFYYHASAIHYNSKVRNFEASLFHARELLNLVCTSDVFRTDSYLAGANMEIANALIDLERYDEAIEHAKIALSNFKPGMINELMALEKLYFCYIRKNEFDKAREVIQRALVSKSIKYNEFTSDKWWFFKAGLEFLRGDPEKAIQSLKNCNALMKDKKGWLLGYSIFEIMCRVENGNLEWFEYRSEALKKIMYRYVDRKEDGNDKRIILIYQVMKTLKQLNYDFSATMEKEAEILALLAEGKGQYYWNPTGYELVRFDEWIKSKAMKVPGKKTISRSLKTA